MSPPRRPGLRHPESAALAGQSSARARRVGWTVVIPGAPRRPGLRHPDPITQAGRVPRVDVALVIQSPPGEPGCRQSELTAQAGPSTSWIRYAGRESPVRRRDHRHREFATLAGSSSARTRRAGQVVVIQSLPHWLGFHRPRSAALAGLATQSRPRCQDRRSRARRAAQAVVILDPLRWPDPDPELRRWPDRRSMAVTTAAPSPSRAHCAE